MDDDAFIYLVMAIILAAEGYYFGGLKVFAFIFDQGGHIPFLLIIPKDVGELSWLK